MRPGRIGGHGGGRARSACLAAWAVLLVLLLPLRGRGQEGSREGSSSGQGTAGQDGSVEALAPSPRRAIAHLRGFQATSLLHLAQRPDRPYELRVVYIFPDRAHWTIRPVEGLEKERGDTYRLGGRAHRLLAREGRSVELEGDERDALILRMELRRAAFLWPDGFAWRAGAAPEPDALPQRTAEVLVPAPGGPRCIGTLHATLDLHGRPEKIESRGIGGTKSRLLVLRRWQEIKGRHWPLELEMLEGGRAVWKETVRGISTRLEYRDLAFLPPDRRPDAGRRGVLETIRRVLLPAWVVRTHPLPAGSSWGAARSAFERLRKAAAGELAGRGLQLEEAPTFELDARGRPTQVILSLVWPPPEEAPEGWTRHERRPGLLMLLSSTDEVDEAQLTALRAAVPPDGKAEAPYVRIWKEDRIQLTLPLQR